ncbi:MAG TPA: Imm5 family immunity protein [Chloroflexia bacterium]
MILSPELLVLLEQASAALRQELDYSLKPIQRIRIYKVFGSLAAEQAQRLRALLAIYAAQQVLPRWHESRPTDFRPEQLLNVALRVLHGTVPDKVALAKALAVAGVLREGNRSRIEVFFRGEPFTYRDYFVIDTALEAIVEVCGDSLFEKSAISEGTKDLDLDWWHKDTASRAAIAYAGAVSDPTGDPNKRREFWEWWLWEAIPLAWSKSISGHALPPLYPLPV